MRIGSSFGFLGELEPDDAGHDQPDAGESKRGGRWRLFEQDEIGPDLFDAACRMGLEGLVSKHRDRPYQAGRSRHWVKVKNRQHPALYRVMDALA